MCEVGARSNSEVTTFDELRYKVYIKATSVKPLCTLPAKSAVMRGNITRAFYVVRNILQLLERDSFSSDPTDYGLSLNKDGIIIPRSVSKSVSDAKLIICKCQAGCERNCPCKRAKQYCVAFCHKKQRIICQNRHSSM